MSVNEHLNGDRERCHMIPHSSPLPLDSHSAPVAIHTNVPHLDRLVSVGLLYEGDGGVDEQQGHDEGKVRIVQEAT